jgi:hypothetical protein
MRQAGSGSVHFEAPELGDHIMMSRARRWITASAAALLALGLGLTTLPARAQTPETADKKITLTLKDAPLRTVIDQIFAGSGIQYAIDANVPDVPVTLSIRDVSLQSALRTVVRLAAGQVPNLTATRDGDIYLVRIKPPMAALTVPTDAEAPPETNQVLEITWEKIPIQFNNVLAILIGLTQGNLGVIPTEFEVMGSSGGGLGGQGGGQGGGFGGGQGGGFGGGGQGGFGGGGQGGFGGGGGGLGGGGFGGGGQGGFGGGGFGGGGGGLGGGGFGGGGGGFGGGGGGFGGGGGGLGGFGGGGGGRRF